MSELFPKTTSDEVDYDKDSDDARREKELKENQPPHHG